MSECELLVGLNSGDHFTVCNSALTPFVMLK